MIIYVDVSKDLHPETRRLVADFAAALADKLHAAEKRYGYSDGWMATDWKAECQADLLKHVAKGDPRDVAAYCAFMWKHGWPTISKPFRPDLPPDVYDSIEKLKNADRTDDAGNIRSSFG